MRYVIREAVLSPLILLRMKAHTHDTILVLTVLLDLSFIARVVEVYVR